MNSQEHWALNIALLFWVAVLLIVGRFILHVF